MQVALLQLAINVVLFDQLADRVHGLQAQCPQRPGVVQSQPFFQLLLVESLAGADVPAVASGRPPANFVRLQHGNAVTELAQVDGGRQSGIARADHTNIGNYRSLQWWEIQFQVGSGGIPGVDMSLILHAATIPFCSRAEA